MPLVILTRRKFEAEMSKRAAEACEQLLTEIGAELHDDVMPGLARFRLLMPRAEQSSSDPEIMIKMQGQLDRSMQAIREVSRRLLSVRTEGDALIDILERLCCTLEGPETSRILFTTEGNPVPLNELVELHIMRIVQELIQNAIKHSVPWHIWVRLQWGPATLSIEVEDDGTGFSAIPEYISRLKNRHNTLKMRSQALGASISYVQGSKGLLARLKMPISAERTTLP